MLSFWNNENLIYIIFYLFVYNLSLISIFFLIWSSSSYNLKTLSSLKYFNNDSFKKTMLLLLFFSIAGIPPLVGFFTKVNLIAIVGYSSFVLLMSLFPFLFAVLYFYLQNVKYLLLPTLKNTPKDYSLVSLKLNYKSMYVITFTSFLSLFGFLLMDDLLLLFNWFLV